MNSLCCNENSGVSLSDLAILKLWHEFRKFVSQLLQHQLAHIIEIIYSKEVLLWYKSVKVLEGTHVEARQGCFIDVSITVWFPAVHVAADPVHTAVK